MYFLLLIVAVPMLFFMATWAIVTAYRILRPEEPLPLERRPVEMRRRATARGVPVPVGARDIREDQRYRRTTVVYQFYEGDSDGVPLQWREDLWLRRN
jgi:hypothetical protein